MTDSSPLHPTSSTTGSRVGATARRVASAMIAAAGVLHLVLVPEYLAEEPFVGILFLLSVPLTGWAAWRLWRGEHLTAWLLGAAVSAGMIGGFLASRTFGLFGYTSTVWAEGMPSLLVEAVFLVLAARHLISQRTTPALANAGRAGRP